MSPQEQQVFHRFLKELSVFSNFHREAKSCNQIRGSNPYFSARYKEQIISKESLRDRLANTINDLLSWSSTKLGHQKYSEIDHLWRYICIAMQTLSTDKAYINGNSGFFPSKKGRTAYNKTYELDFIQPFFQKYKEISNNTSLDGHELPQADYLERRCHRLYEQYR